MEAQPIDRRHFVKGTAALALMGLTWGFVGCSSGSSEGSSSSSAQGGASSEPITMVWLPDNSASDLTASREAIGSAITAACGRKAELLTTTDYNVAIESLATGKAHMALLGAEGYVQANKKNPQVQAAFTDSDEEGGLEGACYYSRISVLEENADQYKDGSGYSIQNIKGKSFSFVTATSTSGFKVPSSAIVNEFGLESSDVLLEAGGFFSEVLFGNSHQGSAVNLLSGDAEVAAFDDVDVDMFLNLVSGEANMPGSVYEVKADAEAPFDAVRGKRFTIIASTPVLNAPFCFNEGVISDEDRNKIIDYFCSDAVANDERIFVNPDDENAKGIFEKDSEKKCFVRTNDAWYDPIRKLSGN
ncbi:MULTISPECIES: phosphate/phosphite/phosphonate ABC transporter substrate-binding protein [unclassified Adlercreutzia]|uniref:phosphate/phosphite/phosphonate ABC transporter substrate-binding protein n=1 Tax=unclassified Adlercreutzia TaxID=2636013 RepID=UPI0013EA36A3|nr:MULTISPECIES: phosphate/phosphite/phosphonate ABC transporter substrate-binding protein [unclassified Adlercreutzia]